MPPAHPIGQTQAPQQKAGLVELRASKDGAGSQDHDIRTERRKALAQPVEAGGLDGARGLGIGEGRRAAALEGDDGADDEHDDGDDEPDEQLRGQRQVLQGLQRSPPRRGAVLNHGLGPRLWGRGQLTFTVTRRETPGSGMVTP